MTTHPTARHSFIKFHTHWWDTRVWTVGLLIVALALRLYHLDTQEVWADAAFAFRLATSSDWPHALLRESNPPLYFILLWAWTGVCGITEVGIRSLSAVIGTLSVAAIIWTGRVFFTPAVGLWAGAFVAIAPMHIYYSQEARAYALVMLTITLCYGTLQLALATGRRKYWVYFSICLVAAMHSRYFAVLALLPTPLLLQRSARPGFSPATRAYLFSTTSAGLLVLPWMICSYLFGAGQEGTHAWIAAVWRHTPPLLAIPKRLEILSLGSHRGLVPIFLKQFNQLAFPSAIRALGLILLAALACYALLPGGERHLSITNLAGRKRWLVAALLLPLIILWLVSCYRPYYVAGRYDMVAFLLTPYSSDSPSASCLRFLCSPDM
jgi:uncharacterized membrane protein